MREIKFRAWDTSNREWLDTGAFSLDLDGDELHLTGTSGYVRGYVLMQYTGLKDKNGKEIYEGDVVALDMWHGNEHGYIPEAGVIKWHQSSSAFKWFSIEEDPSDGNNYWLSQADEHQREVIGNIYGNPELLTK